MTEFELISLVNIASENIGIAAMNIATIFFAYIACSYLVGKKLTTMLSIAISISYTFFIIGPFFAIGLAVGDMVAISSNYIASYPDGVMVTRYSAFTTELAFLFVTLCPPFLAWLISLAYMHFYVRRELE